MNDPSPLDTPGPRRRMPPRSVVEMAVALCALVVSLASLFVARHQAQVMDRQLGASVWPYVQTGSDNYDEASGSRTISLWMRNGGVGPARVRSLTVSYAGRPATGPRDLLRACCGLDAVREAPFSYFSNDAPGRVLTVGQELAYMRFPRAPATAAVWDSLSGVRQRLVVRVCYCSVLDECWVRATSADDPRRVADCRDEEARPQFGGASAAGTSGAR